MHHGIFIVSLCYRTRTEDLNIGSLIPAAHATPDSNTLALMQDPYPQCKTPHPTRNPSGPPPRPKLAWNLTGNPLKRTADFIGPLLRFHVMQFSRIAVSVSFSKVHWSLLTKRLNFHSESILTSPQSHEGSVSSKLYQY